MFDVGGVLCPSPLDEFAKVDAEHGLPAGTVMSHIRGGDEFARVETGRLPIADFFAGCIAAIEAEHGVTVAPGRLDRMMHACMGDSTRPEMLALLRDVKAAGHQTALLTNIFAERREWLHSTFPDDVVDVYCDSSEVGLRKPERPIYDKLLELLGRRAEQVAFVDDFPENLEPARAMGMTVILFESPAQARADLAAAGVRIPARVAEEVA